MDSLPVTVFFLMVNVFATWYWRQVERLEGSELPDLWVTFFGYPIPDVLYHLCSWHFYLV